MAFIMRSGVRSDDSVISFLVVATGDLCEKISQGLHESLKNRKCRAVVHRCESIVEVVRFKPELNVDFFVFAFDWRVKNSITEVEANINLIDEHYIISGCAFLVNCTGVPTPMNLTFAQARNISIKFNLPLMTKDLSDADNILALGDALLNLAELRLGTEVGIPMLPRLPKIRSE